MSQRALVIKGEEGSIGVRVAVMGYNSKARQLVESSQYVQVNFLLSLLD